MQNGPAFWACPGHLKNNWKTCGGLQHYFCQSWSCVTSNDGKAKWGVESHDIVNFSYTGPLCPYGQETNCGGRPCPAQVKIIFNQESARQERSWVSGLSWGLQTTTGPYWLGLYYGGILVISQTIEPIQTQSVGPNQVENLDSQKVIKTNPTQGATTLSPTPSVSWLKNQLSEMEALSPLTVSLT